MKRINKTLGFVSLFFFCILIAVLIYGILNNDSRQVSDNKIVENPRQKESLTSTLEDNNKELIESIKVNKAVTLAILGTDERSTEASRSDIIMILKYCPETNKALIVSVPRDTRVQIPGVKTDKINHAFAFGGAELSVKSLENLFDISIDYYIRFNFESFATIVDELNGVKINSVKDFKYGDGTIRVSKGENILNGKQALFYVRYRSDSEGDYGRIKRQQEVVKALTETVSAYSREGIMPVIMKIYTEISDTNLELSMVEDYFESVGINDMTFDMHTLKTRSKIIKGIWYEIYDEEALMDIKELLNQ